MPVGWCSQDTRPGVEAATASDPRRPEAAPGDDSRASAWVTCQMAPSKATFGNHSPSTWGPVHPSAATASPPQREGRCALVTAAASLTLQRAGRAPREASPVTRLLEAPKGARSCSGVGVGGEEQPSQFARTEGPPGTWTCTADPCPPAPGTRFVRSACAVKS